MYKNLKFLLESYGEKEPLYFGPLDKKEAFMKWLSKLKHEVHSDGSVSIDGEVRFMLNERGQFDAFDNLGQYIVSRLPFNFRKVTGDFLCPNLLRSLTGSPRHVGGNFISGPDKSKHFFFRRSSRLHWKRISVHEHSS